MEVPPGLLSLARRTRTKTAVRRMAISWMFKWSTFDIEGRIYEFLTELRKVFALSDSASGEQAVEVDS
jgi:hypothetical protein